MALGGISFGLNSTLARLGVIENNFQALNGVALEFDIGRTNTVQNNQNSDFKAVLDGKINEIQENLNEISNKEELPKYDDEIQSALKVEDEIEPLAIEKEFEISPSEDISDEDEEIFKQEVNLKPKIAKKTASNNIDEIIETISDKYSVDSNFIKAIIKQESGFNANATSKKGAMGLMQLMPKTAKSLGVINAYNPIENVEGGVKHIKNLLNKYGNNQELALAAYNAGEGAIKRYGGIPPYKETQNYVKSIMSSYLKTKEAQI